LRLAADGGGADGCRGVVQRNAEEGVTWISSFVGEDKTRTSCISDAPSPEAIRMTAARNELPVRIIRMAGARSVFLRVMRRGEAMLNPRLIRRSLAGGLVIAAAGLPTAAQAFVNTRVADAPVAPVASGPVASQPVASADSSFQWGDAELGAAGTIVLLGVGARTASAIRHRRALRTIRRLTSA
jgi:hypothetical protein